MGKAARWVRSLLGGKKEQRVTAGEDEIRGEDKKRWSFGRSWRERAEGPSAKACTDFYLESEKERNRHAIIVAAATAAAADAAVAAAQAAAAVVKLTTYGRRMVAFDREEERAALKIQCVFRGHLARKALMALRALVKLQALVRGHIVRKRLAVNNIHKWGALDAVNSGVRPRRTPKDRARIIAPEIKHRRSQERSDESRTEPHSSSLQSRRLSTTPVDAALSRSEFLHGFDDCPGIAEINVGRPKPRTRRASNSPDQSRLTTPRSRNSQDPDDYCWQSSTTQSTPRFFNSSVELNGPTPPVTPRQGIWTQLDSPNYMANTQSFKAKLRSQSVPKLRSEPGRRESSMETVVEPRACVMGLGVRRSCSQA